MYTINWRYCDRSDGNTRNCYTNFPLLKEWHMIHPTVDHYRHLWWRTSSRSDKRRYPKGTACNSQHLHGIRSRGWHIQPLHCRSGTCHIRPSTTGCCNLPGTSTLSLYGVVDDVIWCICSRPIQTFPPGMPNPAL